LAEEKEDELFEPDETEAVHGGLEGEEAGAKKPRHEEEAQPSEDLAELNDRYLRLYAEFENYRKRVAKDKEEMLKYAHESMLYELLPSLDHLEIALKHVDNDTSRGIVEGVEMTLRELYRTLEKFGLKPIEAEGRPFDPEFHHAVSQVETDDMQEKMVVEEFRKGYVYQDKVLRASMVSVSRKPAVRAEETAEKIEEANE
jgi:molecular chaperone GrpE